MQILGKGMGSTIFLLGLGLAVISGFVALGIDAWVLVVLGLVVGYLNIKMAESVKSMISALILGASGALIAGIPTIGAMLSGVFQNVATYALSAAIVPAVLCFYKVAKK